ncbi:hypothetical protein [Tunturiibacter gelidiferens]|uniref:hypothetical protein n=1 Tax=Tunturiibacter gelidiferens TaxID=3069689 RepID=UPI003D9B9518
MVLTHFSSPTLALLIWHSASVLLGQQPNGQALPTIVLNHQDSYSISTAPFSFTSTQCDGRGDVFFDLLGRKIANGNILRASADGQHLDQARLPTDLGKHGEWHYSVTYEGALYAIFSEASDHRLIELSTSNEEVRRTTLQLPRYFHVHSFAVLPEGNLMVAGSIPVGKTSVVAKEAPLLVWLAPDGRVLRQEVLGEPINPLFFRSESFIATGRLHTFVATTGSAISEFSPRGDLIQTFRLPKPSLDSWIVGLEFGDAHIAVEFAHPDTAAASASASASGSDKPSGLYFGPVTQTWLMVNPVSGEAEGFYEMPPNFIGSAMCYLGGHDFLYLQVTNGKPTIVRATKFP